MDAQMAKAAYNNLPPPESVSEEERAAYLLLRITYQHFKTDVLPRNVAEVFKEQLMDWRKCPLMERAALLVYGIENEFDRVADWETMRVLVEEYFKLPLDRFGRLERRS